MTVKTRLTRLEQHQADTFMQQLAELNDDEFHARLAAMATTPAPYLWRRIMDDMIRRFRLMTEEDIDVFIREHSTPEEYARLQAMSDAELEALTMGAYT